jgi:hypothetical protein
MLRAELIVIGLAVVVGLVAASVYYVEEFVVQ